MTGDKEADEETLRFCLSMNVVDVWIYVQLGFTPVCHGALPSSPDILLVFFYYFYFFSRYGILCIV